VKIIGFEMKVLVALVTEYSDWLGDCVDNIYQLTASIQRSNRGFSSNMQISCFRRAKNVNSCYVSI